MNEEKIRQQAKRIMDSFMEALETVPALEDGAGFESGKGMRKPGRDIKSEDFRKRMLANAPRQKNGRVIAEKKTW